MPKPNLTRGPSLRNTKMPLPKPKPVRKIEPGEKVTVKTTYTVKRVIEFEDGCSQLVSCEDAHGDRVVTFRLEELELVHG